MYIIISGYMYFSRVVWGHMPQKNFGLFLSQRQLLVQSEAKILIELLNICLIDNTDLLAYCMKKEIRFFSSFIGCKHFQKCGVGWGGGAVSPLAPLS